MGASLNLGVLEGSLRQASLSRAAGRAAAGLAPEGMSVAHLPNPGTIPLYDQDVMDAGMPEAVATMIEAVKACDAVLVVTPEYNWSVPGALKNAIDWMSRVQPMPLAGKPVAIWSVSPGLLGGARVHESLRQVLHSQGALIMAKPEVQIAGAKTKLDVEASTVTDEAAAEFLRAHLREFDAFCRRTSAPAG